MRERVRGLRYQSDFRIPGSFQNSWFQCQFTLYRSRGWLDGSVLLLKGCSKRQQVNVKLFKFQEFKTLAGLLVDRHERRVLAKSSPGLLESFGKRQPYLMLHFGDQSDQTCLLVLVFVLDHSESKAVVSLRQFRFPFGVHHKVHLELVRVVVQKETADRCTDILEGWRNKLSWSVDTIDSIAGNLVVENLEICFEIGQLTVELTRCPWENNE